MAYTRMSSSACAGPKSSRCRVRDIVSCFYPRLISPEEQHNTKSLPKTKKRCGEEEEDGAAQAETRFAEEDYIVFCFGENGEIHMINDATKTSSESQPCIRRRKGDETEGVIHVEQPNQSKIDSFESCDSNPSDTSTSSFAFPVLGMEWIGSPVHMPSTEKHHGQACLCRRNCRF